MFKRVFFMIYFLIFAFLLYAQPMRERGRIPFETMDVNGDRRLSQDEFRGPGVIFQEIDINNDGYLTKDEMRRYRPKQLDKRGENAVLSRNYTGNYPDLVVKKYDKDKVWPGNVIFVDKIWNRVVEVNLEGKVIWEFSVSNVIEDNFHTPRFRGAGLFDVELLPDGNILVLKGGQAGFEVSREGELIWQYENPTISHDIDRLPNGNTLFACAGAEQLSSFPYRDPQAIEVNPEGKIVWAWYAKDEYLDSEYKNIRSNDAGDWTHLNSVQRLKDGNTLLSIRNWNQIIVVDKNGKTVWKTGGEKIPSYGFGKDSPHCPHTPVLLDNGNIIISEPIKGRVIEWNPKTKKIVWKYPEKNWQKGGPYYFIRAAHRLPNGNTFIIDSLGQFIEVTYEGDIVWQAQLPDYKVLNKPAVGEEIKYAPWFNADREGLPPYRGE